MNTPICDFVNNYIQRNSLRLHMPGHKGCSLLGMEKYDITEITGADSLYEARGIISQSESNAGSLFGCNTFYSAEGSSLCIKAMLQLVMLYAKERGASPVVLAGRNAHKAFMGAAALLDFDIEWLYGNASYLSCNITAEDVEKAVASMSEKPVAVYITSPDYLGNITDINGVAEVCHRYGILLLVDNAHGAYLKFLPESMHPIDSGADICCDSAHKTLPVLTGGAYLHISLNAPKSLVHQAKGALALFGSTSPSYLILQSLDYANKYIADGYSRKLKTFVQELASVKALLTEGGYKLYGEEPLKITIAAKKYGYYGVELAEAVAKNNIECEFADNDYAVMMLTPETGIDGLNRLKDTLLSIPERAAISEVPPVICPGERVMSVREAMLSPKEEINIEDGIGRVLSDTSIGCPPAIPIGVWGERITGHTIDCFKYYGISKCLVTK